ncbi:lipocalin-like domain-containing protein [Sneathiella sp.]|uniref:lipocalin-like domain-containing protein n=1 Tax=Sneathiella sp. TaxID=1964365 RepID=UPI003564C39F
MFTEEDLIGSWTLQRWQALKNTVPAGFPMGDDALGQIIYSADGRMSGFLMRADFAKARRGTDAKYNTSLAYGGIFRVDGDQVIHDVLYATIPHWIGMPRMRTIAWDGDNLLLKTAPETSNSGTMHEHHLVWKRVAD